MEGGQKVTGNMKRLIVFALMGCGFASADTASVAAASESDETYWPPTPIMDGVTVLATSVEDKGRRGSTPRAAQPIFWCYEPGAGRVFGCVPGHRIQTFDDPLFRKLLLRGMAWAGGDEPARFED